MSDIEFSEPWNNSDAVILIPKVVNIQNKNSSGGEEHQAAAYSSIVTSGKRARIDHSEMNVSGTKKCIRYYVHTAILSLASPVFQRMFESEYHEGESKIVQLPGKDPDVVLQMLRILYATVHIFEDGDNIEALLEMGHMYEIKRITDVVDYLLSKRNPQVYHIYLSEKYNLSLTKIMNVNFFKSTSTKATACFEDDPYWSSVSGETKCEILLSKIENVHKTMTICDKKCFHPTGCVAAPTVKQYYLIRVEDLDTLNKVKTCLSSSIKRSDNI